MVAIGADDGRCGGIIQRNADIAVAEIVDGIQHLF